MKMILGIAVATIVIALVVLNFYPWYRTRFVMDFFLERAIEQAQQRRILLLCETDHQALLKDGREILRKVSPMEKKIKKGHVYEGYVPFPKEVKEMGLPETIRKLKPRTVLIRHVNYKIYLTIEMHGGMDHFGVYIYPEDSNEPRSDYLYGRELIPGLWYYDDGYLHNPEYDKHIDALIEEHKQKK